MAVQQTLDTYELLERIIAAMPPKSIINAERVCKTWRALVTRSVAIARARCLEPVALIKESTSASSFRLPLIYARASDIATHPATMPSDCEDVRLTSTQIGPHYLVRQHHYMPPPELGRFRDANPRQFATNPPLRRARVQLTAPRSGWAIRYLVPILMERELDVAGGIRMGDLQSFEAECAQNGFYEGCNAAKLKLWIVFGEECDGPVC